MFTLSILIGFSLGVIMGSDWKTKLIALIILCLTIALDLILMSKVNNKIKEINPQYPPDHLSNTELIKFRHSANPTYDN